MKLKLLPLLLLTIFAIACSNFTTEEGEEVEQAPREVVKTKSICIWDGVALRKTPTNKEKNYISSISLGEKISFLNETAIDTLDKNREYLKVELSDGTIGWVSASVIVVDAELAAIREKAPIYKRPDILTLTNKQFDKMEMLAVGEKKGTWVEVTGNKLKKRGWIKEATLTKNEQDVAIAILARKALFKNGEIQVDKIEEFLENLPYKDGIFVDYLKNRIVVETPEVEEAAEEVVEDTDTQEIE